MPDQLKIEKVHVSAFTVPTKSPESDGTLKWDATTLVLVRIQAGGKTGIGYSYADVATAQLIEKTTGAENRRDWMRLRLARLGIRWFTPFAIWAVRVSAPWRSQRSTMRSGISKANALELRLRFCWASFVRRSWLTAAAASLPIRIKRAGGSAGRLGAGRSARGQDENRPRSRRRMSKRVKLVREAIGPEVALFVDANGAYTRKQALLQARRFAESDVTWFEEPVSSDDLDGLRLLRDQGPEGMAIAAGEYGYDALYFRRMLAAEAVDVQQADATRCAGITGFMQADALV